MNTPLTKALAQAFSAALSEHFNRFYSKPPLERLSDEEIAALMLPHLEAFTLDWLRVEDELPDADTTTVIAIENDPEMWIGYLGNGGRWYAADGVLLRGRVYAWAPFPETPNPTRLIGFHPRSP